ncbi:MAG: hypothetical protein WCP17_03315 [bacterium]
MSSILQILKDCIFTGQPCGSNYTPSIKNNEYPKVLGIQNSYISQTYTNTPAGSPEEIQSIIKIETRKTKEAIPSITNTKAAINNLGSEIVANTGSLENRFNFLFFRNLFSSRSNTIIIFIIIVFVGYLLYMFLNKKNVF